MHISLGLGSRFGRVISYPNNKKELIMKYSFEEYINFISEHVPTFSKGDNCFGMFTVPTQHKIGNSIVELLNIGIECAKAQNGKSALGYLTEQINKEMEEYYERD